MTKSKTPITDKYVEGYNDALLEKNCSLNVYEIEYLRNCELTFKEETPTKALEVLIALEKTIQDRLKSYEISILAAEKAKLKLEYESKCLLEKIFFQNEKDAIKEEYEQRIKEYLDEAKNSSDLLDTTREALETLEEETLKEDKEILLLYINKLKVAYRYTNKTRNIGKGMFSKEVKVDHIIVLQIFQEMLKEIGINL